MSDWTQSKEEPTEDEQSTIEELVQRFPVDVFQALNKRLNQDGSCIMIDCID